MKRLCSLAIISLLAISGCKPSSPSAAPSKPVDLKPADPATPLADVPPLPDDSHPTFTPQTHRLVSSGDVPLLEQINRENEKVVAAALPSVVRITAMSQVQMDPHSHMFGDLPFNIPGLPHGLHPSVPSYGSGVIISKDGYIITNDHVVIGAESVEVQLHDERTFAARVVAADEDADIAVLKVNANDLPALPWGDSDKVQVGEQVFAFGNPFDLEDSVSRGIISAKGRNLPDSQNVDDYIQTDAAINVGNSGGALVNIHGELIGINAAIASFTKGNEGVGFSIPSNLVRHAVEGLLRDGRLVRGYLGVQLPVKVDDGVVEQLGLDATHGALLAGVLRKSPADLAQLRPVDFITEVDGRKIDNLTQLRLIVSQIPVGKQVKVNYIRAGEPQSTTVKIAELPKQVPESNQSVPVDPGLDHVGPDVVPPQGQFVLTGLRVTDLNSQTRAKYGIDDIVSSGVVVTEVKEGSPSDDKGLERGDVIDIACAQRGSIQTLTSPGDFVHFAKTLKPDQNVVLLVHHGKLSGQEDRSSIFVCLVPSPK
jgi:serine protease Do